MNARNILVIVGVSMLSALSAVGIYDHFKAEAPQQVTIKQEQPVRFTGLTHSVVSTPMGLDFRQAAKLATPGVVHVKTKSFANNTNYGSNPFQDLFGDQFFFGPPRGQQQPRMASGSGVIISGDGLIVTNNHVIRNAETIEVTLNDNRTYTANLIGTDPNTDIALLKIENVENLPHLPFADSDSVEIGSWVLAVGNPFDLSSTVTAGIVSAKGRNINILEGQGAIESFIQTDAAVNPGNSGGALVDISGNLIGINTAIASPTGSYSGYSFAVPANLVRKVVYDINEFGMVQRGFLGVTIRDVDQDLASELNMEEVNGVYIAEVLEGSAADEAGIKSGDVVRNINGVNINRAPELQEAVAQYRPGDELNVVYLRDGKTYSSSVVLKNSNKGTELLSKAKVEVSQALGAQLADLTVKEQRELGVEGGVKITKLGDGKLRRYTNMKEGFIITHIDSEPVTNSEELLRILENKRGGVMLEGKYPKLDGEYYYAFGL